MSHVRADTIEAIADGLGIAGLSREAAAALAPQVDVRLREVIQDAAKVARASKRACLIAADVDAALAARGAAPLLGHGGGGGRDAARFARAAGTADVFYAVDRVAGWDEIIDAPLPKPPVEAGVIPHWLAVDGVQPDIPENAPLPVRRAKRGRAAPARVDRRVAGGVPAVAAAAAAGGAGAAPAPQAPLTPAAAAAAGAGGEGALIRAPVRHALSEELAAYLARVTAALLGPPGAAAAACPALPDPAVAAARAAAAAPPDGSVTFGPGTAVGASDAAAAAGGAALLAPPDVAALRSAALASLASDPGLHPLAPYLVKHLADGVAAALSDPARLTVLARAGAALASNPGLDLGPYLHLLLPSLLTVAVARRLGPPGSDHWAARDAAAAALGVVAARYGRDAESIPAAVSRALLRALRDPGLPLGSHYGAVRGLASLGRRAVRGILLPALAGYAPVLAAAASAAEQAGTATTTAATPSSRAPPRQTRAAAAAVASAAAADAMYAVERVRAAVIEEAAACLFGGGSAAAAAGGDGGWAPRAPPPPHARPPALLQGASVAGVGEGEGAKEPAGCGGAAAKGGRLARTPSSAGRKAPAAAAATPVESPPPALARRPSSRKRGRGGGGGSAEGTPEPSPKAPTRRRGGKGGGSAAPSSRGGSADPPGESEEGGATDADGSGDDDDGDATTAASEDEDGDDGLAMPTPGLGGLLDGRGGSPAGASGADSAGEGTDDERALGRLPPTSRAAARVLAASWREDVDAGAISDALRELFGDAAAPRTVALPSI